MAADDLRIFALRSSREFGERVASGIGVTLSEHEERDFADGEHKIRPLVPVRDCDVFVVHALYADAAESVNDKLCRLLFLLGALRDASARRITAVVPYLCYARKDRRTELRDPVTTRYVAKLFEALNVDHLVTLDVHNPAAFQNAFHRTTTDELTAMGMILDHLLAQPADPPCVVVSPDIGGIKRAGRLRDALSRTVGRPIGSAFIEKHRRLGVVRGTELFGDVAGKSVLILDDLISTGTTLSRAAAACREAGAARIQAAATHGVFAGEAESVLGQSPLETILVTNSISPYRLSPAFVQQKLVVLDVAPLFARAIRRMHEGGSLAELLSMGPEAVGH